MLLAPLLLATTLGPCSVPGYAGPAQCGTHEVFENRAAQSGRRIGLKIVVLPATGKERRPDPLAFINGGPGESATDAAAGMAQFLAKIHEARDILLVDQRGTGGSHALNCRLFGPDLQSYLGDFFPPDGVQACRAELEKDADLTQYTTPIAMDDLEEVRAALGYPVLNLFAGSYGTRAALAFMRQHPSSVRTAILQGVDPPTTPMPLYFARDAQRALDGVLGECAADAACHSAFPDLAADARAMWAKLEAGPVPVEIVHPETGDSTEVRLSRDLVAEAVRYLLYQSGSASLIPGAIHAAAKGDLSPLAEFAVFGRQQIVSSGALGLYLSITCAEDLPWIRPGEGETLAAATFLRDYRLRQQRRACDAWPRATIPADYRTPVSSAAPTLLLSGQSDPVTPPSQAEEAARTLPNALHIVVPSGGHSFDGLVGTECIDRIAAEFIERGGGRGLDTACVATVHRPGFVTSLPPTKPVTVAEADLRKLAGRYTGDPGPEATVEALTGKLRASLPGGPSFVLVPVSPNRFRVAGALGMAVVFEVEDGVVKSLVLEQGGQRTMVLKAQR